ATRQAHAHDDYELVVDIDAHTVEFQFWDEIIGFVESDVLRHDAKAMLRGLSQGNALLKVPTGTNFQSVGGRIPHGHAIAEPTDGPGSGGGHRFAQLMRRSMDAMGLDYQVVFPSAMLLLGLHTMDDVEVNLAQAFNRWIIESVLPSEDRLLGMLYLPFNTPDACVRMIERHAHDPRVIGYTVTSTRNKPVHHNSYMKLYRLIEETGKPLSFHTGFHWGDPSFAQLNRFISMHALSFAHYNMIHLTNWLINGLPERFPELKLLWVEAGLAWIPFLMQRLDHEAMMRPSEAPSLKRLPSEYMREMYFTSQPMERANLKLLQATMEAMSAETQLLYASDWPHWDFDPPSTVTSLPFLSEQAKRNILGLNAARLFDLPVARRRARLAETDAPRRAAE
ncbi:MAG TPA: amidohydrolase family protein, partial [Acetobacteraceae bacterium]|nr:amidohydrolase family protein [Acetobacteraceae bacterium]